MINATNPYDLQEALYKLLWDTWIIYRGKKIEKCNGGFLVFDCWYSHLGSAKAKIDSVYLEFEKSINRLK